MTGVENGVIGQRKDLFCDALHQRLSAAAGVLPVSYAALKDRVAHESNAVFIAVIDHGIRCVAGRVNDPQAAGAISQTYCVSIPERTDIPDHSLPDAERGQIHLAVQQIAVGILVGVDGNAQSLPQFVDRTGVVEVPVGQQDRLYAPTLPADEREQA